MNQPQDGGISKVKLALGAASLFLFLIGLKRSFRRDDGSEVTSNGEPLAMDHEPESKAQGRKLRNAS